MILLDRYQNSSISIDTTILFNTQYLHRKYSIYLHRNTLSIETNNTETHRFSQGEYGKCNKKMMNEYDRHTLLMFAAFNTLRHIICNYLTKLIRK